MLIQRATLVLLVLLLTAACAAPAPASQAPHAGTTTASSTPAPAQAAGAAPRLAVDKTIIDYGDVPYGKVVAPVFAVKNEGKAPLLLKGAKLQVEEGC